MMYAYYCVLYSYDVVLSVHSQMVQLTVYIEVDMSLKFTL
jgi:hypothetical protein